MWKPSVLTCLLVDIKDGSKSNGAFVVRCILSSIPSPKQANQEAAHEYWKEIKNESNFEDLFRSKISILKTEASKPKGSILGFFKSQEKKMQVVRLLRMFL